MDPAKIDPTLAPTAALDRLVLAADGRAPRELVALLLLDQVGPWMSARVGARDFASTRTDVHHLLSQLDSLEHAFGPPLQTDRGPLAWLKHYRLARPVAELEKAPAWLADPALAGAWVALPPTGWPDDPEDTGGLVRHDGRLVAVQHLVAAAAGDGGVVTDEIARFTWTLAAWCAGPTRAVWSDRGAECRAVKADWTRPGPWRWFQNVAGADVAAVAAALCDPDLIRADWTPPPPTEAELAEQAERERIIAAGKAAAQAWDDRPQVAPKPRQMRLDGHVAERLAHAWRA